MAKVVELVGVSGVGKTAVFNSLRQKQNQMGHACLYRNALSDYLLNKTGNKGFLRWLEYQIRPAFPAALQYSAAERFVRENPQFSQSVWNLLSRKGEHDSESSAEISFKGARLFYKNFAEHQVAKSYQQKDYVILDEGFVQRFKGYRVGDGHGADDAVRGWLSKLVSGVVFLDASVETIKSRASGDASKYKNLSNQETHDSIQNGVSAYKEIISGLESDGVNCQWVDASGALDKTVENVLAALERF